jgi:CheY-like chemotaxis protein
MGHSYISCCFYPTLVFLIDDDAHFLDSIGLKLRRRLACRSYVSPIEVAEFFVEKYSVQPFTQRLLLGMGDEDADQKNITVNVKAIHQEMYNANRFNEASVVLVDYAMPDMNGLELCQLIKNPIKKILLTGEADEKLAIEAFNKEIIHRYIRKDDPKFLEKAKIAINELQEAYFQDLSKIVISSINSNSIYHSSGLNDPILIEFFNNFIKKHSFVEYYLIESIGSFLCLDAEGKPTIFAVTNDDMMETYYRAAVDHNASESIVTAIKNKKMFPFFYSKEDYQRNPSEWKSYLHPAHVLSGKNTYYYSIITDTKIYDIQREKIKSYHQFLDQFYQAP